jgi:N-acetylmuramoyl-L-alanine amidase
MPVQARVRILERLVILGMALVAISVPLAVMTGRLGRGPSSRALVRPAAPAPPPTPTLDSPLHAGMPTLPPARTLRPAAEPTAARPTAPSTRIGLVAGHWKYDTGAVCPDGRQEVQVTTDVAQRVRALLEQRGHAVDVLPEHDPAVPQPPLQGYRARVLVSIHADSCDIPGASGFKVARWMYSGMPEVEDRLVACLNRAYQAATRLPRHDDSITVNMRNYYAFRELAQDTPAAIIELGFLLEDRATLDEHRYEMALGVADGIGCFLQGDG